ncbi:MAG: glycosyltransferase [Gallionellaceae bacterium]|jgi:glycosyltransferase involved in cell wall biosynthesis|nr:glycosyltransferase [Gallionellaceae bacterium]
MRVLMVSDVYFPRINGVSTAIDTYRRSLSQEGIDIRLIAPDYGLTTGDESWIKRIPSRPVPRDPEDRLMRRQALAQATLEAARDADLIHIQTPFFAYYAAMRAAKQLGLPVITTYHTLFEEYFKHYAPFVPAPLLRAAARKFSRAQCDATNAVIVPSRAIQQRLLDYGVRSPLHILPTGIPLSRFSVGDRQRFRRQHGIAENQPMALYVGRVAHEKNLDFLLDVAALTRQRVPDFLLMIAGEGPALPHLRERVAREGLQNCVRFTGYLDRLHELPDCYAAADAFVFASRTETQGLVLLEAMAMGVPVVALAVMGTVDILENASGAVVPADDITCFANDLGDLLLNPECRAILARQAREQARHWDERTLAGRMAGLYRETLAQHGE